MGKEDKKTVSREMRRRMRRVGATTRNLGRSSLLLSLSLSLLSRYCCCYSRRRRIVVHITLYYNVAAAV